MIDSDFLILAVVSFTRELVVNFYCKSTPEHFINAKYSKRTQGNYLRILKERNINPVFLPNKVNKKIDFTDFEEQTKPSLKFTILKIILLSALLRMYNTTHKKYYIKPEALTSIFTAEAYFHEDGGG